MSFVSDHNNGSVAGVICCLLQVFKLPSRLFPQLEIANAGPLNYGVGV